MFSKLKSQLFSGGMLVWGNNKDNKSLFSAFLWALGRSFIVSCTSFILVFFPIYITPVLAEEIMPQITRPNVDVDFEIDPSLFPGTVNLGKEPGFDFFDSFSKNPGEMLEQRFRLHRERVAKRGNELPLLEVYSGGDGKEGDRGFYVGGVMGPLDKHINLKGLRLRAGYGQGSSEYSSKYQLSDDLFFSPHLKSQSEFFEGLIGYEFRFQKSIFKVYGGFVHEKRRFDKKHFEAQLENFLTLNLDQTATQADKEFAKNYLTKKISKDHKGSETGVKFLVEAWRDFENGHWFSGYASYTEGTEFYTAHSRYGMPVSNLFGIDVLHIGAEVAVYGNEYQDLMRAGVFSRVKDGDGEWTVSVGLDGDTSHLDSSSFRKENLYVTLQYFQRLYLSELSEGLLSP